MFKGKLKNRNEIDDKYKWQLEDMYSDYKAWEIDYEKVKDMAINICLYSGKLHESPETLYKCLSLSDEISEIIEMLFVYARMRRDEDNSIGINQEYTGKAMSLVTEVQAMLSFIVPEITAIDEKKILGFLKDKEELQIYDFYLKEIIRQKKHILSEKEEKILAMAGEVAHAPGDIFTMFNNADLKFPSIKNEEGEDVEVTKGRYIKFMESQDRRVRKDAFTVLYKKYSEFRNTLAASLINNIKKNKFFYKVRNYSSALESSLDSDNIKTEVYDNLIKAVSEKLPLLHKYYEARKKIMKLDELHLYDTYVPLIKEPPKDIPYEEALKIIKTALRPMGKEYLNDLDLAFNNKWIDVYENKGKTSGAYSWGAYKAHPYVLLNYQGTLNDVSTIAHEMGHALHSYYSNNNQPYVNAGYKIFVAEVASTVNESLLIKYMIEKAGSDEEKAFLINKYLEEFKGTIFRQTMFAEFEKITHEKIESGEALTADSLDEIYTGLNKKYFGDSVVIDDEISAEWSRIPHFYSSFYVYKYATGFSAATALARQLQDEGEPALKRYLNFLKSGGSDYPLNLLKKAGVDLTVPKPVSDALDVFGGLLTSLTGLLIK
jgi:oligoendopeptidase F